MILVSAPTVVTPRPFGVMPFTAGDEHIEIARFGKDPHLAVAVPCRQAGAGILPPMFHPPWLLEKCPTTTFCVMP